MSTKEVEVQFHLDRSFESTLALVRSIVDNPRIPQTEKLVFLRMVSNHHRTISETLERKVAEGVEVAVQQLVGVAP